MSKIAKEKAQDWMGSLPVNIIYDDMPKPRVAFALGYDQSAKDVIARIRVEVERRIPDGNEEYEIGERIAYNSMIVFLQRLEKEYE